MVGSLLLRIFAIFINNTIAPVVGWKVVTFGVILIGVFYYWFQEYYYARARDVMLDSQPMIDVGEVTIFVD